LNNLAYTYLASGSSKPERALGLVDQALDYLPKSPSNEKYRSHFYDTRAIALMRLDRMAEAAAEFENALQARPDDEKVLESLIECCKAAELDCEDHEKHLREIRQRAAKEK